MKGIKSDNIWYDEITGLPNKTKFQKELCKYIERNKNKDQFAIAYIDIDDFRHINDTLGHKAGNCFLKYFAKSLENEVEDSNLLVRLDGNKFAILFINTSLSILFINKVKKINENICKAWSYEKHKFYISLSIGIALYPDHGEDIRTLLQNVETAMNTAKQEGKDIVLYKDRLQEDLIGQTELAHEIAIALEKGEFTLYYQPQFDLNTKDMVGVEALVRWIHPVMGMYSPGKFIPVAEKSKQIYILEQWILENALQQKRRWEESGNYNLKLSINLSSKTLENPIYFNEMENLFASYPIDYSKIVIEITETAFLFNMDLAKKRLNRLRNFGLKIALDDFGTGYSSLNHIRNLPIDIIKIDRSFIKGIPFSNKDSIIIKNIVSMAHDLNLITVAEGIENCEQLEYIKYLSCDIGQGYLLGMPMDEEKLSNFQKNI